MCRVPLDDVVVVERLEFETNREPADINNAEAMDVPDSCEYAIVLDSDDEGAEVVGCGKEMERTSCKWKLNTLVYKRRRSKNVGGYCIQSLVSARRTANAEEHCEVEKHGPVSFRASDVGMPTLEEEILHDPNKVVDNEHESLECGEKLIRRNLAVDVTDAERLPLSQCETKHELKNVPNRICQSEFETTSNADSQEPEEPSDVNALDFVDHFLSVNNLNVLEKVDGGKPDLMKSPPAFSAKGVQILARRATLAEKARELAIFDWDEKLITEGHSVNISNEEFDERSLGQSPEKDESETCVPDTFDVGYDTQMAAEAMEALIYASPPNTRLQDILQVPTTEVCNLSEDAHCRKESKICASVKMPGSVSQINRKQLENMKIASTKLNGNISCPLKTHSENLKEYGCPLPVKKKVVCRVALAAKSLNCREPPIVKKVICGRNSRLISQQKVDEYSEIENSNRGSDILSSSKFTDCRQHRENTIVKKNRKPSNTTKGSKWKSLERSSEVSKYPVSSTKRSMNNNLEFNVPKKRRTRSSTDVNICKTNERKFLNSSSKALLGIMSSKRTQQVRSHSGLLKFDPWCCTKKKRTHKGVPRHSIRSGNSSTLLTVADDENKDKYSIQPPKWMGGPLLFSQSEYHSFPEKRPSMKVLKQKVEEKIMPGFDKHGSMITSEQKLPLDLDRAKSSNQSAKSDIMSPVENIKLDAVSADSKASRTSKSNEERRVPDRKLLVGTSLMKELTRLGYSKSLPNFIPRELRRRRNENVAVLFSQHLEPNILNRQKKIVTRLGFSVASFCSDATHFVTDRFVRTRNMLEAIALGKPVVTHFWLESCDQANSSIDEKCYIMRDAKKEKEIGFSMPVSLASARENPLLMGRSVFITPNVKPCMELIQSLVKAVHGKTIKRIPKSERSDGFIPRDLLILSCEEDYAACVPLLEKGAAIYDSELLLNGIVIQKLEFERHQLFSNSAHTNNWSRKRPRMSEKSRTDLCGFS